MSPSAEYKAYALEHLETIGLVETRRFFGGVGICFGSVQFAMMIGNNLYFVVDDTTRTKYRNAGMQAFSYMKKTGRVHVHRYYELPEDILTDPEQLRLWANEALHIAGSSKPKNRLP